MEKLTLEICEEYRKRAKELGDAKNPLQKGKRRALREELQERCKIPEIWATNILNGYYSTDYLACLEKRRKDAEKNKDKKNEVIIPFDEIEL